MSGTSSEETVSSDQISKGKKTDCVPKKYNYKRWKEEEIAKPIELLKERPCLLNIFNIENTKRDKR